MSESAQLMVPPPPPPLLLELHPPVLTIPASVKVLSATAKK
jgi:hypothetical protein